MLCHLLRVVKDLHAHYTPVATLLLKYNENDKWTKTLVYTFLQSSFKAINDNLLEQKLYRFIHFLRCYN